jgi:hypothetical protein
MSAALAAPVPRTLPRPRTVAGTRRKIDERRRVHLELDVDVNARRRMKTGAVVSTRGGTHIRYQNNGPVRSVTPAVTNGSPPSICNDSSTRWSIVSQSCSNAAAATAMYSTITARRAGVNAPLHSQRQPPADRGEGW